MLTRFAASFGVFVAGALVLSAGDAGSELKKLEGEWKIIQGVTNGRKEDFGLKPIVVKIAGAKMMLVEEGDNEKREMTFVLDPSKSPKWIDLTKKEGDKGETARGIYKLAGDELTICIPEGPGSKDAKRPVEFAAPEGSNLTLVTFKKKS
jgi:uncharacterized protein (TIGR03067 family)